MGSADDERRMWFRREILPLEQELRAYAQRFCRHGEADVDDLVHDTFARVIAYEAWAEIENPAGFAARTLRNIAFDAQRRGKIALIDRSIDVSSLRLVDEGADPEVQVLARDELLRLREIVEQLPDQVRRVFTLRKVYGLAHKEIAEQLGLSVSTVEKHLAKGLRICSDKLGRGSNPAEMTWSGRLWNSKRRRDGSW